MADLKKPHDRLFLEKMGQPENAAAVLSQMLPEEVSKQIDWTTLKRAPERYAPQHSDPQTVDLLFEASARGQRCFIYFLFEHQSQPHPLMPFRMLHYEVQILDAWQKCHREATKLPAVIPALLCHGPTPWSGPTSLLDCYQLPDLLKRALQPWLVDFSMVIEDLGAIPAEALRARVLPPDIHLTLFSLQRMREGAPLAEIEVWAPVIEALLAQPGGGEALERHMWYILGVTDHSPTELHDIVARHVGAEAATSIMTTAEKLRDEGREDGLAKGRAEGRTEGRAETLLEQLCLPFS